MKNKMKNKKADITVKNFLSIVLAVVVLLLLAYGIWKVYDYTSNNQERKAAIAIVDTLGERINALPETTAEAIPVTIKGINKEGNWNLLAYDLTKPNDLRPGKCFFKPCICVCKGQSVKDCQENGFCRDIESDYLISETTFLTQRFDGESDAPAIVETTNPAIPLPNKLFRILLQKTKDSSDKLIVKISYKYEG